MKQFIIKPHLVGDLTFAKTTSGSTYGSIKSHWARSGSTGEFHIEIPVNTMARVTIPARARLTRASPITPDSCAGGSADR